MNTRTALASVAVALSLIGLSACTASDEPALEKGQEVNEEGHGVVDNNGEPVHKSDHTPVPKECGEAFDHAADVSSILGDALDTSADAVGYALDLDYVGLDQTNEDLEGFVQPLQDARTDYATAASTCKRADPPQDCVSALGSAEEIDSLLSQGLDSASRSLQYAIDYDADGLDEEAAVIEDLTEDVKVARDDFITQSASCNITEGA